MPRQRRTPRAVLVVVALLVGCTTAPGSEPGSGTTGTASAERPSETGSDALTGEHGVLTEAAVAEVAPGWTGSTFQGDIQALPGYDYGGDCQDSAWDVLYLFEALAATSTTFQATSGRPAPMLTIGVLELSQADRERDLAALTHQLTECVGESADGELLQQPISAVDGWSGLDLAAEGRDVYWASYEEGVVVAELDPGAAGLNDTLRVQAQEVLALQLDQLG